MTRKLDTLTRTLISLACDQRYVHRQQYIQRWFLDDIILIFVRRRIILAISTISVDNTSKVDFVADLKVRNFATDFSDLNRGINILKL